MVSRADILDASILIVDDQEANVSLLEQLLREAGYTASPRRMNPHEVCALHRKNRYDLILLDLQMPGMDGFQVMEGLKTNEADGYLPVLVITAQPGHKLRALQAGAKDFISKPFDLVEVKTRIRNMLEVRLLYKKLETLQQGAGADGAGADRRTARKRSALSQPDRAGLRLVLGAGRERATSPRFPARSWRCSASGSTPLAGDASGARTAGWNEAERDDAAGDHRRPAAVPGFRLQPRQCRRLAAAVPGQRRADVQPVLPLHRLPRHRRGTHSRRSERRDLDRLAMPSPHSPNQNHLLAALPAAEFERLAAASGTGPDAARRNPLRTRRPAAARLFPHHRHRVAALRHGVRRVGRNRRRGQRRRASAFRCSWAATPRPARPWCRPRATPTGWSAAC